MSRNVNVLIFDNVEVLDFAGPFEVFHVASEVIPHNADDAGPVFNTITVGLTDAPVVARGGLRVTPHASLWDAPTPDVLVVPGGFGVRRLLRHDRLLAWLTEVAPRTEIVLSVCTGSLLLAQAGLLAGLRATTHHTALARLPQLAPDVTPVADARFVDQGHIVTAGGISAGIDAALHVVARLHGDANAALVRDEMEWLWHTR